MSLKGHLGTIALPELLQWLAIGQKTGTLVIVKDDGVHRVVVDRGRIISTATSDENMQLGRQLLAAGLVDELTLERARKLREATGMSLGRVLLTLQAVSEEDLREALRDKAEALISMLFHSSSASFQFVEDSDLGDPGVALSLDATQLVLSAATNLEQLPEADAAAEPESEHAAEAQPSKKVTAGLRPTPVKATATVIETLPETPRETAGAARRYVAGKPDEKGGKETARGRRRAVGGLAAAAVLVAAVAAVLMLGRSHVPAKAEESADRAGNTVRVLAPLAAGDLAAASSPPETPRATSADAPADAPVEARVDAVTDAPTLDFPTEAPAATEDSDAVERPRLQELLAEREAEVRNELDSRYKGELADLRRQLDSRNEAETSRAAERDAVGVADGSSEPGSALPTSPPAPVGSPILEPDPGAETEAASPVEVESEEPAPEVAPREVPSVEIPARLISRPAPVYPAAAQRLGRSASVTVRVLVGEDGRVAEARAAGRKAGMGFDEAALTAARRSRWVPATSDGVPVSRWVDLRFDFQLP